MRALLRRSIDELWLLKEGRRKKFALERGRYQRLVFVCKGNICRSVYAERYAATLGLRAISRGLITTPGCPPDSTACLVARARGVMLDGHKTASWNPSEVLHGDLVLVMEPWQLKRVVASLADSEKTAALLGAWETPPKTTIADPYGLSVDVFHACFSQLESNVNAIADAF